MLCVLENTHNILGTPSNEPDPLLNIDTIKLIIENKIEDFCNLINLYQESTTGSTFIFMDFKPVPNMFGKTRFDPNSHNSDLISKFHNDHCNDNSRLKANKAQFIRQHYPVDRMPFLQKLYTAMPYDLTRDGDEDFMATNTKTVVFGFKVKRNVKRQEQLQRIQLAIMSVEAAIFDMLIDNYIIDPNFIPATGEIAQQSQYRSKLKSAVNNLRLILENQIHTIKKEHNLFKSSHLASCKKMLQAINETYNGRNFNPFTGAISESVRGISPPLPPRA